MIGEIYADALDGETAEIEYVDRLAHGPRAKFRVVEPLGSGARG